jgi:hypothetical protein
MPVLAIICTYTIKTTGFDKSEKEYNYLKVLSVMLAAGVVCLHLLHLFSLIIPDSFLDKNPSLKSLLISNPMEKELQMKSAMAYKLNQLTVHAYDIHDQEEEERSNVLKTCFGQGLYVFNKRAAKFETVSKLGNCYGDEGKILATTFFERKRFGTLQDWSLATSRNTSFLFSFCWQGSS